MKLTLYVSDVIGKQTNCYYKKTAVIENKNDLVEAIKFDNVSAKYKGFYRSNGNFEYADNIVMDCDNDHSENASEWIDEEKVALMFKDVNYVLVFSRNHQKQKKSYSPRPRFHIYFPIKQIDSVDEFVNIKNGILAEYPFFDKGAVDGARFIYGSKQKEVIWHEGSKSILEILHPDAYDEFEFYNTKEKLEIKEGSRNATMSKYAGKIIKKYGDTEEAYNAFIDVSHSCNPPLDDNELKIIWKSAQAFFNSKVKTIPEYVDSTTFAKNNKWKENLLINEKKGKLVDCTYNLILILENDPDFSGFAFNDLANQIEIIGKVPWVRPVGNKYWRDADTSQLLSIIDRHYTTFSTRNHDVAFTKVVNDRHFHPIRDYLNELPKWDGVVRVDDFFIKYFEADDTEYIKAVTRKTFVAAVARIFNPGVKFDSIPVLDGEQGIGKSSVIKYLAGEHFFSDRLSLTDMNDKTGAEKLQGFWIVEIGELAGMKKADIEKVKSFISCTDDKYRASYGRVVESHPRQCIIFATVNGERGYLRDITGNRRFWIIKVNQKEQKWHWSEDAKFRDQFWVECIHYYKQGEKLYLEGELLDYAKEEQRKAMEVDERLGIVEKYLNTLLPANWDDMDLHQRRDFLDGDVTSVKGTVKRKTVSNAEIWCECYRKNLSEIKPTDSYALTALMAQLNEWER